MATDSPPSATNDTTDTESPEPPTAPTPKSKKQTAAIPTYTSEEGCLFEPAALEWVNRKLIENKSTRRLVPMNQSDAIVRALLRGDKLNNRKVRKSLESLPPFVARPGVDNPNTPQGRSKYMGMDYYGADLDDEQYLAIAEGKISRPTVKNCGPTIAVHQKMQRRRMRRGEHVYDLIVLSPHAPAESLWEQYADPVDASSDDDSSDSDDDMQVDAGTTPENGTHDNLLEHICVPLEDIPAFADKVLEALQPEPTWPTKSDFEPSLRRWQRKAVREVMKGWYDSNKEHLRMHLLEAVMGAGKTRVGVRCLSHRKCRERVRIFACHATAMVDKFIDSAKDNFGIDFKNYTCSGSYVKGPKDNVVQPEHIEAALAEEFAKATPDKPAYIVMCHRTLAYLAKKEFEIFDGISTAIIIDEVHKLTQHTNNAPDSESAKGKRRAAASSKKAKRAKTDAGVVERSDESPPTDETSAITPEQKVMHQLVEKRSTIKSLGMSATLPRDWDGQSKKVRTYLKQNLSHGAGDAHGVIVDRYGLQEALLEGVLVELQVDTVFGKGSEFAFSSMVRTTRDWIVLRELGTTVVYARTIKEAKEFKRALQKAFDDDGRKAWVQTVHSGEGEAGESSNYPKRNLKVMKEFEKYAEEPKEFDYHVVINVELLVEGFDLPPLASVVFLSAPTDHARFWQMVGRVMRAHPHKAYGRALVFDHAGHCADMYAALVQDYSKNCRSVFHRVIMPTRKEMIDSAADTETRKQCLQASQDLQHTVEKKARDLIENHPITKENVLIAKFKVLSGQFEKYTTPMHDQQLVKLCRDLPELEAEVVNAFAEDDKAPKLKYPFRADKFLAEDIRCRWRSLSKELLELITSTAWWPPTKAKSKNRPYNDLRDEVKAECEKMIQKKWTLEEVEAKAAKQGLTLHKNDHGKYTGVEDKGSVFKGVVIIGGKNYATTFPKNALGAIVAAFFVAKLNNKVGKKPRPPRAPFGSNKLSEAELQEALANSDLGAQLKKRKTGKDGVYVGSFSRDGKYQAYVHDDGKKLTLGYYSTPEEAGMVALLKEKERDAQKASDTSASSSNLPCTLAIDFESDSE